MAPYGSPCTTPPYKSLHSFFPLESSLNPNKEREGGQENIQPQRQGVGRAAFASANAAGGSPGAGTRVNLRESGVLTGMHWSSP